MAPRIGDEPPRTQLEVSGYAHPAPVEWILHFGWPTNPIPANGSRGGHYAHARQVRAVRQAAAGRLLALRIPTLGRCEAQLTWWVTTNRRRDVDNLAPLEKPLFDELVNARIVADDTPDLMVKPRGVIRKVADSDGLVTRPGFTLTIPRTRRGDTVTSWPATMKIGPIRTWPGNLTRDRRLSPFRASLTTTLKVLDREIYHLADTRQQQESAELLVAIPASAFRLDGRPRADARAEHPGVIFSMDTRFGRVSYPCDSFTTWEDNLRAVALALEALRKVDRYGVTKRGEQYRGFLALEAATAAPAGFTTGDAARAWLTQFTADHLHNNPSLATVLRTAQRLAHPDTGGDAATFQRVSLAEAKLRDEGLL